MDLLFKSILAALVIAAVLVILFFAVQKFIPATVTQQQAVTLVLNDLKNVTPTARVNITNVTPSQYQGSWRIIASVVFNGTTPCPSYYIYSFDYPKYGFVYRLDNNYTNHCIVYGLQQNRSYILASYPVAIARSYNLSQQGTIPSVANFVNLYGYRNVVVTASYYPSLNLSNTLYNRVWIVNYSAPTASYSVYTLITQVGGSFVLSYNKSH